MQLPSSISPCPIYETVFEVRFGSGLPGDAVFGVVYQALNEEFPTLKALPLADVPKQVLESSPELQRQPLHRMEGDQYIALVGPRMIAFATAGEYPGWKNFYAKIQHFFDLLENTKVLSSIERFGLRYISFFPENILPELTLEFLLSGERLSGKQTSFKTTVRSGCYLSQLNVASSVTLQVDGPKLKYFKHNEEGSVIDIDTYVVSPNCANGFRNAATEFLEIAHSEEKALFFSLLKEDFISKLSPKYEAF